MTVNENENEKYAQETNILKKSIENRIEKLRNAANTEEEIKEIRKLIEGGGLGNNNNIKQKLNDKISSLRSAAAEPAAAEPAPATEPASDPNANRLARILERLKGAPSGSNNNIKQKLTVLSNENKNFLRKVSENNLSNQLLKNAKLAIAQQATTAVTDAE